MPFGGNDKQANGDTEAQRPDRSDRLRLDSEVRPFAEREPLKANLARFIPEARVDSNRDSDPAYLPIRPRSRTSRQTPRLAGTGLILRLGGIVSRKQT